MNSSEIVDFVSVLEGYKTCLKTVRWNAGSLSEHKLCDDVADELSEFQDTVAEIYQQIVSRRIKASEFKPVIPVANNLSVFLDKLLDETKDFYDYIVSQNVVEYVGISSEVETFIGKLQKFSYQASFCSREE